eukprot:TRINITY_DN91616_c0_g1_i1.p1 TRINITY_DN91616_c0_g1~~TRINITY_DN91616_c0_g1_i1.p1  ORF type:complete len:416 (-),score=39.90 TRINITY_DN91616_c0_g1_i1:24-1271(-)
MKMQRRRWLLALPLLARDVRCWLASQLNVPCKRVGRRMLRPFASRSACRGAARGASREVCTAKRPTLRPLTDFGFGAEVVDVDLASEVSADCWQALRAAFEEYSVLVFRQPGLSDEQLVSITRAFASTLPEADIEGSSDPTGARLSAVDEHRDSCRALIGKIANFDPETGAMLQKLSQLRRRRAGNGYWHSDSSYKSVPAVASILYGRVVPPVGLGGETEFASSRAAYAALDDGAELEQMHAVHDFSYSHFLSFRKAPPAKFRRSLPPVLHPLVRRTQCGRSLYVGKHCSHIVGRPLAEGRRIVRSLNEHITRPEFVYRHSWLPGDLVLCDQRSTLHRGRPWQKPAETKRMVCLTKIAQPVHDAFGSEAPTVSAVDMPSEKDAELLLRAVGLGDLEDAACGHGALYCQPRWREER